MSSVSPSPAHVERPRVGARGHHLGEPGADEVQCGPVTGAVARDHPVRHRLQIGGAALRLVVIVNRVGVGEEAHPAHGSSVTVERGHALLEPAQRPGAQAGHDHSRLPRGAQHCVDAVGAPRAEQRDDAAAPHVDEILGGQVGRQVRGAAVAAEERDVRRPAAAGGERPVEADDVVVRVARGGGEEAHARALRARQGQRVLVEQRVAGLHREPASAHGEDLTRSRHAGRVRAGSAAVANFSLRSSRTGPGVQREIARIRVLNLRSRLRRTKQALLTRCYECRASSGERCLESDGSSRPGCPRVRPASRGT